MGRLAGIEGVRGLAALSIVLFHVDVRAVRPAALSPEPVDAIVNHLWLGVTLFFVLSGFLLYRPYAAATIRGVAWPPLGRYARARILRIVPAYWLAVTVAILFLHAEAALAALPALVVGWALLLRSARRARGGERNALMLVYASCLVLLTLAMVGAVAAFGASLARSEPFVKDYLFLQLNFDGGHAVGPAWTLCVEAAFYVALPVLALAMHSAARRARSERGRATMLAVCILPLVAIATGYQAAVDGGFLPIGFLDQFAAGMLLAVAYERRNGRRLPRAVARLLVASSIALVVVASLVEFRGPTADGLSVAYKPLMAAAFAVLLAAMLLGPAGALRRFLDARPVAALGVVSYGIFLWHDPILLELDRFGLVGGSLPYAVSVLIVTVLATVAATFSWLLLERKALARKGTASRTVPRSVAAAPSAEPSVAVA